MRGSDSMNDLTLLGPWVRRFLLEHLVAERNLARNTQRSYRDALTLLIPFVADKLHPPVDRLTVVDVSADLGRLFLADLEQSRHCAITTRNQRLAAVHALAGFVENTVRNTLPGAHRSDPFRSRRPARQLSPIWTNRRWMRSWPRPIAPPPGLSRPALLLFLYNSGARAEEAAQVLIGELDLAGGSVKIRGKGGKERCCPLWPNTVGELTVVIAGRSPSARVFLNRCSLPITRFGIHTLVERYIRRAQAKMPSLEAKRISPHTIRHTTATHLLRAGVDINTVRAWLGHVSVDRSEEHTSELQSLR